MSDRVQDLTNHRKVAVACKNYTDKEIKASEERILSIVARNNVDFIDHTDEATYRFTAPANAKLLMLQSIAGNSVKYSPSVASDNNATHIKTLPSTVYDLDVSKVEGVGYKVNQFFDKNVYPATQTINGITFTNNGDGSITLSGTATELTTFTLTNAKTIVSGHKYLTCGGYSNKIYISNDYTASILVFSQYGIATCDFTTPNCIFKLRVNSGTEITTPITLIPQFFDLTADFGSGNEPSTVSDCATEYAKRGINIYEYTPQQSSIKNNAFTGVKVEGANLFDEETELGGINTSDGATNSNVGYIRSKNFNNCLPNTTYYVNASTHSDMGIWFYDSNYNYIIMTYKANATFTTPTNAKYYKLCWYATTYNNDICINISGSANGTYVPYIQPTTISVDLTTIKDSNNVSLFPSGKLMGNSSVADFITPYNQESRWNEVDLSTFSWNLQEGEDYWYFRATWIGGGQKIYSSGATIRDCVHSIYSASNQNNIGVYDNEISWTTSYIYVRTNSKTTTPSGILQFARETPLTSNTDLTSLTGIQGQSLGTITLNNTGNVDMPNLISYNGVIKHALATAVKQEGFNVWNEVTELGELDINGENKSSTTQIRSKNYIDVQPNTTYYFRANTTYNVLIAKYDSNKSQISQDVIQTNNTFTTPSNCAYIRFHLASAYGTTYQNDICINISGTLNGTYKPHKPTYTRALTNNEAKYSWGITTGVRNVRTYCDDEGNAVNEGSLSVDNKDMGELSYTYLTTYQIFTTTITGRKDGNTTKMQNSKFNCITSGTLGTLNNLELSPYFYNTNQDIIAKNTLFDNANIFKTAMSGVPLFYEKNTTDTETLDDFDYFFDCEEGDTFTLVNTEQLQCYATYSFLIKEAKSNE